MLFRSNDLNLKDIIQVALDLPEFLAGALVFASLLAHFYNIFVFFCHQESPSFFLSFFLNISFIVK